MIIYAVLYKKFVASNNGVLMSTDLTARGLDIPDVDWIVQYDAPQQPDAFVHRIGRTARMGREGKALVFIHPNEETYIGTSGNDFILSEFLSLKKVPLSELPLNESAPDILRSVKRLVLNDRDLVEKVSR